MFVILRSIVESSKFQLLTVVIIVANAVVLGLQTIRGLDPATTHLLEMIDFLCLIYFCIEIVLKLVVTQRNFFKDGWNIFDVLVIGIALVPASGELSVLRTLRVLRLMRLVSALPAMRRVVVGMFSSIPGVASVAGVLLVLFYIAAVMATKLFGETSPQHFGSMGATFFTLFQMMTLEGWPDIARVVMEEQPTAWMFFVPFIIFTTFTTLNLLFGIIVNSMEEAKEAEAREKLASQGVEVPEESAEVRLAVIESELKSVRALLERMGEAPVTAPSDHVHA